MCIKVYKDQTFDEERALYGANGILVEHCSFDGPADGESAFKEGKDITVKDCFFNLRYPFWHDDKLTIESSEMTELCRAALWYSADIAIRHTDLHGNKALRECSDITLEHCDIISPEFGWFSKNIKMDGADFYIFQCFRNISKMLRHKSDTVRLADKCLSLTFNHNFATVSIS